MTTTSNTTNDGTMDTEAGKGGSTGGNAAQVTPFSTAAKGAALRRMRQAQQAMNKTMSLAQAAEKGREEERVKKAAEEAAAAAAVAAAAAAADKDTEKDDEMEVEEVEADGEGKDEGGGIEDKDGESLDGVVRVLDKELATPTSKKRRSGELKNKKADETTTVAGKTYAAAAKALRPSSFVAHNYQNPRVIIEGSARLEKEDKVKEFLDLVGVLLTNGKIVDQYFAIAPVIMDTGKKNLREVKDIPVNMTSLGSYIKISEKSYRGLFEKKNHYKKAGGKGTKNTGGSGSADGIIYFTFAMACDVEPMEVLQGITVEWMRAGGIGLYRKEIQAFNTFSPFVIFYLYNGISVHTVMAEFKRMMEEAIKMLNDDAMVDDQEKVVSVPPFAFRKSLPKLPGLNPEEYAGLKPQQAATRRAWHIELETQHVETFNKLIEQCKEVLLFQRMWGEHVLISRVVEYDSPPGDIKRVLKTAKRHTSFHVSMTVVQLYGIMDLDAEVPFIRPAEGEEDGGSLTLRDVMLRHFRTRDGGSPLFAEIHQKQSGGVVEAVVPNIKEVDSMVGSINRQLPAFVKHYLLYKGLSEDFVTRLVVASCCPVLVGEMNTVVWDGEALDLKTAEDTADDARLSAFEKADWFIDIEKLRVSPKKKAYTAPEALFLLDEARSVSTLHAKNDSKRAAAREGFVDSDSEEEDETDSASDERDIDKSSQDLATDKAGEKDKSISWASAGSNDERLASQGAAGGG